MITAEEARNMANGVNELMNPYLEAINGNVQMRSFCGYYDCEVRLKLEAHTLLCTKLLKYLEELGYNVILIEDKNHNSILNINWKND